MLPKRLPLVETEPTVMNLLPRPNTVSAALVLARCFHLIHKGAITPNR